MIGRAALLAVSLAGVARFTAPMQPWASADGSVRLLRPATARASTDGAPLGSLMSPGWRLMWDGRPAGRGTMLVRLVLPVVPSSGPGTATEVLQIGRSRASAAVRTCLSAGLSSGSERRLPSRAIGGLRFAAWANGDAGMSQQIAATDLRAVVDGACYAVERFRYAVTARDPDPAITLLQAQGAAMLDASLASLRIGRHGLPLPAPPLVLPPHAVAR